MRQRILSLLQDHPDGLTPAEMQERLGVERSLTDTCQGMLRYGLVQRVGHGRYVAAASKDPCMRREAVGKVLAMVGVVTLALSIMPTGDFTHPDDSWFGTQWKWIQHALRHGTAVPPVTISPILLYLGLALRVVGMALSGRGGQASGTDRGRKKPDSRTGSDMQIFVGSLAPTTTEAVLRQVFAAYGTVGRIHIPRDRETGRTRGFGFIEMPHASEAQAAIAGLNGTELGGRPLTVNEARQREERPRRPRG